MRVTPCLVRNRSACEENKKKGKAAMKYASQLKATLMGRNAPGTATTRQGINSFLRIINKSMLCVCVPATTGTDFERCTADLSCVPKSGCNKEETTEKKISFLPDVLSSCYPNLTKKKQKRIRKGVRAQKSETIKSHLKPSSRQTVA